MSISGYITVAVLLALSFLAGTWYRGGSSVRSSAASDRRILYYHDPMHPSYKSDKPGIAPDCGMRLQPVYADSIASADRAETPSGDVRKAVRITSDKQQLIGITVTTVEMTAGPETVRTVGRVAIDETRLYRISTATEGWIQDTPRNSVGSFVRRDQVLMTYYTRELRSAAQAYLYVLDRLRSPETARGTTDTGLDQRGLDLALEGLRNLGVSDHQIQEIEKGHVIPQYVALRSPVTGFIIARNVSPLQRFSRGEELYKIADLSRVWILADLFETESHLVSRATAASVVLKHSGQVIHAKVSQTLPQFDGLSRTLKVRLEADNPGVMLKPDMFVDVEFPVKLPPGLTIPVDAVLDSGRAKTVFVALGDGYFEPRPVETGWHFGGRVQVVKGLKAGEKIVVSGNFLIDSEVRMRNAPATTAKSQ